jgi:hypothetical protein
MGVEEYNTDVCRDGGKACVAMDNEGFYGDPFTSAMAANGLGLGELFPAFSSKRVFTCLLTFSRKFRGEMSSGFRLQRLGSMAVPRLGWPGRRYLLRIAPRCAMWTYRMSAKEVTILILAAMYSAGLSVIRGRKKQETHRKSTIEIVVGLLKGGGSILQTRRGSLRPHR